MPYAKNGDMRIYYETVGQGPPLVLQQGYGGTADMWNEAGYVDALKDEFTLILSDQRGVGRSDRPHDPQAYAPAKRVGDVTAVLDDLGFASTHLWGYSYGAMTAWYAARLAPQRFRSMIIGGASPHFDGEEGEPTPFGEWLRSVGLEGMIASFQEMFGDHWVPLYTEILHEQSFDALIAARELYWDYHTEEFLDTLAVPVLCYAGSADQPTHDRSQQSCEVAPHAQFISVANADHVEAWFATEQILPQVIAFLHEAEAGLTRQAGA